jgi:hypothetical protein
MEFTRVEHIDPGLLSPEELLLEHKGGRRKSLEKLIEKQHSICLEKEPWNHICRDYVCWFLDSARLNISVSDI